MRNWFRLILHMRLMKYLSIIITLVLIASKVTGQDLSYRQFSTRQGMPSAQVYHMFQDDLGYMWFATDRGIAKYDGKDFLQYDQRNGLPSSTVFKYYPQKNGDVWCSTFENKWFYFNPTIGEFKPYKYNDSIVKYSYGGLNEDFVVDEDGVIHVGYQSLPGVLSINTDGAVLNKPDLEKQSTEQGVLTVSEQQGSRQLSYCLHRDATDTAVSPILKNAEVRTCWFSPLKGTYFKSITLGDHAIFSMESQLMIQGPDLKYNRIDVDKSIIGMGTYRENQFWVGLRKGGLQVYDLEGNLIHEFLVSESVTCAFHDQHNGLWISTPSNGVFYAKDKRMRKHALEEHVSYINNGKGNQVLVGVYEGGVYECSARRTTLLSDFVPGAHLIAVQNNTIGGYAIFSGAGSIAFPNKRIKGPGWVGSISENEVKPVLFGSHNSVYYWDNKSGTLSSYLAEERVRSIDWTSNGIWVGTLSGLFFCDTLEQSMKRYTHPLLQIRIDAIWSTESTTFLGTMGNGLLVKKSDTIIQVSMSEGLSSNLVHNLFVENDSTIWVATNNGLNRVCINADQLQIDTYNEKDGLQDNYISDIHVKGNLVWIGTRSGLFYMEKPPVHKVSSLIDLRLTVQSVHHNGELLDFEQLSEMSHNQNDLLIKYNTIFFGGEGLVEYRYKLSGIDQKWTPSLVREVSYKSLAPGEYELLIQARTATSNWEENETVLEFAIWPPFYKTSWFFLLVLFSVVLLIYLFFKIRVFTYNRDIVRELLRMVLKRLSPRSKQFKVKVQGATVKVNSIDVGFVKASGNYLEIHTSKNRIVTRMKIGDFENLLPDKLDYVRVNRSYIVRIDKISVKSTKSLVVMEKEIPIGRTYQKTISELLF